MRTLPALLIAALMTSMVPACAPAPAASVSANAIATASPAVGEVTVPTDLPLVTVHKSPTCGCCQSWVEHLQRAGFPVRVIETEELAAFKEQAGVPGNMTSCHTAEVAGYFIEGHVPARDIIRLVTEHPDARGLAVPGMPQGAPGMGDTAAAHPPYSVFLVANDRTVSEYKQY